MKEIGLEPVEDKEVRNLTALQHNSQSRKEKKTGTKGGRKGDIDEQSIIAGPNSMLMNKTITKDSEPDDNIRLSHSTPKHIKAKECNIQSNLDYSKCQGPQESFRIIGSWNDRNWEFRILSGKQGCFHRTSLFCQCLQCVFREVIGTSVNALTKMSYSSSLMLCRSKNAERKRKAYIFIDM